METIKKALLNGAVVLDVRNNDEFLEAHYPNALHIPLHDLENRYTELDKSKTHIVYCKLGIRSAKAMEFLESKGFKVHNGINLTNLNAIDESE